MEDRRNVPKCDSFYDFMVRIRDWYGTMIAFKSEEHEWSYEDIYRMVLNVSSVIKSKQLIYCIDVTDPVLFFVVFMAVTISGNIAWLSENAECEQYIYLSLIHISEPTRH